jgi:hypothetical protein
MWSACAGPEAAFKVLTSSPKWMGRTAWQAIRKGFAGPAPDATLIEIAAHGKNEGERLWALVSPPR